MNYETFKQIFNQSIFEKSKVDLIEKIALYPSRYIGLFRPTKPKAKLLQNLLQSHEIRFGDAFEKLIEEYLKNNNFTTLEKKLTYSNGDKLNLDQLFKNENGIFFVEQKVRDDHDSTKKRGQILNFEKKLETLIKLYRGSNLKGFFYFIDPDLTKNKNYYQDELKKMSDDYNVVLEISYGNELFYSLGIPKIWDEIINHLKKWRDELPEIPEINFDLNANESFNEIKDLSPSTFRKLFDNEPLYSEILPTIFPQKRVLKLLKDYFLTRESDIYKSLAKKLNKLL